MEIYLDSIKKHIYRVAMSQLRTSSYTLAIEYGGYTHPKPTIEDHNCSICHVLEDERYFVMDCTINQSKEKICSPNCIVPNMNDDEIFLFLKCNKDQQILTWVGKFIHKSFKDRAEHSIHYAVYVSYVMPSSALVICQVACVDACTLRWCKCIHIN